MRKDNLARVPVVDERPAVAPRRRLRVLVLVGLAGFVLGAAVALVWAWREWKDTIRPDPWPWTERK